jgi:hypothetical protein
LPIGGAEREHCSVGAKRTALNGAVAAAALCAMLTTPASGHERPGPLGPNGGSDTLASSGVCTAGSTWELAGRSRYLRIVVEARVGTQTRRQRWVLILMHNQTAVARTVRKPTGRGVVKVRGRVQNQPGPDTFTFVARNRTTAETCQGTLTF